jgi:uncharacterized protein (DUF1778 family)
VTSTRPPSAQPASPPATLSSRRQAGKGSGPAKTSRIELRATEDDRDLLDRAAAALGTDRSSFLLAQGRLAAQRVLADREHFLLEENRLAGESLLAPDAALEGVKSVKDSNGE